MNAMAVVSGVLALGAVAGGTLVVEDRYATKSDVETVAMNSSQLFLELRIDQAKEKLNEIHRKVAAGIATPYDLESKQHLERELDRLYQMKNNVR